MRALLYAMGFIAAAAAQAQGVAFERVWPQWHEAAAFESYHEATTGRELTGGFVILRSHPESRGGLYFVTRVNNRQLPLQGARFVVRVIAPDSTDTRVFTFPADVPNGSQVYQIGLTGADWAGPRVVPVAWEVSLVDSAGSVLAHKASYLWEKPEGPRAATAP